MSKEPGVSFIAQIYKVESKKDGGGRLTLEFGSDSIEAIQFVQKFAVKTDCSFQIGAVPLIDKDGRKL